MFSLQPDRSLAMVGVIFCLLCLPMTTYAAVSTWTLSGVTFADGGTAAGSFDYDPDTNMFSNWMIITSGGNTGTFPVFTYDSTTSTVSSFNTGDPQDRITFRDLVNNRHLRVTPVAALTDAGGTIALDLATGGGGSGGVECFNCSPFRLITAGSFQSPGAPPPPPPPIPALGGLGLVAFILMLALVGLWALRRQSI